MNAPVDVTPALLAGWRLPHIADDSDKEDRGRVLVLGGGTQIAGATVLVAMAALRAGAGKLQIAAPKGYAVPLSLAMPEARVIACTEVDGELGPDAIGELADALEDCDAAVVGPGLQDKRRAGELALRLCQSDCAALVIDAAAMVGMAEARPKPRAKPMVITPHLGEMAALTGLEKAQVEADPLAAARRVAAELGAVVALKSAETFIVSPDGASWRHVGHAVGLATSGSGDVLAGLVAGLLARGADPAQAAVWGVYIHAEAGRRLSRRIGRLGFLARELLDELAPALSELETPPPV